MLMADMAHIAGLIAGEVLPNPLDFGFQVMTSTTHKTLRGPRGGMILSQGMVGNTLKAPDKTIANLPTLIDREIFPGFQGGPHMNTIAAKAVCFYEAMQPRFKIYARQVLDNSKCLADELMKRSFRLITNGTDNHMMMADIQTSFGISGREAQDILDSIGLSANCNAIPNDPLPPFRPSGLRIGTPAMTTRGLKEREMIMIAEWIEKAIKQRKNSKALKHLAAEVKTFALKYPLPSDLR